MAPPRPAPQGATAAPPAAAGGTKRLLRLEGTLPVGEGAAAVAINADESLLAVAQEDGNTAHVLIFDRPSKTRIGMLSAKVGGSPRIAFAPTQDLLLIAGGRGVQLWDVPIVPLKPDQPLDEKYRLWEQSLRDAGATPHVAFSDPPSHAVWSLGGALFRRDVAAGSAPAENPAWQADGGRPIGTFSFARGGAGLAVGYAGEKTIDLLDSRALTLLGTLTGHRLPVVGVVSPGKGWLSLDTGWHVLRWSETLQQQDSTFLQELPRAGEPAALNRLGARHVLIALAGTDGGGVQRIVTSPPAWAAEDRITAPAEGLALSPTGRYVLALEGRKGEPAKLYGFSASESPLDYVRRLQSAKAYRAAQGYVRLLDESGLSPKLKSSLLAELSQVPASVKVQDFHERLARARRDSNADGIRHWAEQILNLRPQDPDALAALQDLKTQSEQRILNQAREALKQGQTGQVISVLSSQIPADSALQGEAAALIRQAEAQRRISGLLGQAREQMALGNYAAASALVQEALRENQDDPAARSLLSDLQDRSGGHPYPRWIPIGIGMVLALAVVGFLVHRNRARLMPLFRRAAPAGTSSWGGLGRGIPEVGRGPSPGGPARPRPSPAGPEPGPRPAPRAPASSGAAAQRDAVRARPAGAPGSRESLKSARAALERPTAPSARVSERGGGRQRQAQPSPARLQVVEELLQRTEDMMRLAQQADAAREHVSLLMELDAELAAFHRRLADPAVVLGPIHQRLKMIGAQLRGLEFIRREPPPPKAHAAPPGEPTWYEVLHVSEAASEAEIRASYHKLLKQYHPDLHNHSDFPWVRDQAEQMTKKLGAAFQVLSHADKRQEYDRELRRRRN